MQFYTTEEVADIFHCTPKTIRNLINAGKIKALKLGSEFRISEECLQDYIQENTTKGSEIGDESKQTSIDSL